MAAAFFEKKHIANPTLSNFILLGNPWFVTIHTIIISIDSVKKKESLCHSTQSFGTEA